MKRREEALRKGLHICLQNKRAASQMSEVICGKHGHNGEKKAEDRIVWQKRSGAEKMTLTSRVKKEQKR